MSFDYAGPRRRHQLLEPARGRIWYIPLNARGRRSASARQGEYIAPFANTVELPIFEKLFLGGEYSVRGFDLRTVGPRDPVTVLVLGGNKSLLFNAEYLINIAGPVRLVLFDDAGQVRDEVRISLEGADHPAEDRLACCSAASSIPQHDHHPFPFEPEVTRTTRRRGQRLQDARSAPRSGSSCRC